MKILVTGSHGRIGANLVTRLLEKGHTIRGFVYPGDAGRARKLDGFSNVELIEGDLRDYVVVEQAVAGVDAICHLAAAFQGSFSNREFLEINGMGTLNLLEAVRAKAPSLHRFVYASTEAIYWSLEERGRLFEKPVSEDEVSASHRMPYFLTKWIGEELCMNYHLQYRIPSVSCRFATVFEPSEFLNEDGVPKFCALRSTIGQFRMLAGNSEAHARDLRRLEDAWEKGDRLAIQRCPDGRSYKQEWCDVRDIAKGITLALHKEDAVGETFTLGGLLTIWEEVVPQLSERLAIGYADVRMPTPNFFEFDHTKVRDILGYSPDHDLWSTFNTALAHREGKTTDVIPAGVAYEKAD